MVVGRSRKPLLLNRSCRFESCRLRQFVILKKVRVFAVLGPCGKANNPLPQDSSTALGLPQPPLSISSSF